MTYLAQEAAHQAGPGDEIMAKGGPEETAAKASSSQNSGNVREGPQSRLAKPLVVDTKLMSMEESRAAVVAPAPGDEAIVGVRPADLQEEMKQNDSGISSSLEGCFEDISSEIFGLPFSVSVAIPSIQDTPLIGISDGFLKLSGYSREEVVGQNCRLLLKGVPKDEVRDGVRQECRRYCRAAHLRGLARMAYCIQFQRNARKNGELFWNMFMLSVCPGPDKKRTYIVGLQLDLGPELPPEHKANPAAAIEAHRDHLLLVQHLLFGKKSVPAPLTDKASEEQGAHGRLRPRAEEVANQFVGLVTDVKDWLDHAEGASASFLEWGTRPWAVWPGPSAKHALLNGGATLLRLEADRVATGAIAMSIFAADRNKPAHRSFRVEVDEICPQWGTKLYEAARLPSLGFTKLSPVQVDELGGLTEEWQSMADSVCMCGDGSVFLSSNGETKQVAEAVVPSFDYDVKAGDVLEFFWTKNAVRVEADGEVVRAFEDPSIGSPPKDALFPVVDCSHAVCRMTLKA